MHDSPVLEIKSTSLNVVRIVLSTLDHDAIHDTLKEKLADAPDFFNDDPVVLDFHRIADEANTPNFAMLVAIMRRYHMMPIGIATHNTAWLKEAHNVGLACADLPARNLERLQEPARTIEIIKEIEILKEVEVVKEIPIMGGTQVIDKPLRSGQRVYAKNSDLLVLDVVNRGAEIIADGHIHVYAPLYGKAIAGARGMKEAMIFTTHLDPELVAIAGIYRTIDDELPADLLCKPAKIRLQESKLVIDGL